MRKNDLSPLKTLAWVSQLGITMMVPLLGAVFLGNYLDKKFSGKPIFLILFTVIAVMASLRNLYIIGIRLGKKGEEKKDDKRG